MSIHQSHRIDTVLYQLFYSTEYHVDQTVEPPKIVCLRRHAAPENMVPALVSDARVKYDDNFDWDLATPRERAKGKTALRQRKVRQLKKEQQLR
jgi:hypothetical protein